MKGRNAILHSFFATALCVAVFCLRRGWERPLFALVDGLFVSGLVGLTFTLLPRLFSSKSFDGFSYALRWVGAGFYPKWAQSYERFKGERESGRKSQPPALSSFLTYAVFLLASVIISVFFW